MRQFYKKISSVCMALLCIAALLIGCTATAWAADEIDDSVKSQLVKTTEGLTDAIIAMSEDDIQGYLESEDAFTQSAASAWDGSREELGKKKVISMKKISQWSTPMISIPLLFRYPSRKTKRISLMYLINQEPRRLLQLM